MKLLHALPRALLATMGVAAVSGMTASCLFLATKPTQAMVYLAWLWFTVLAGFTAFFYDRK